jgi:hypothetical protein
MIKIEYNKAIEVNKEQYDFLVKNAAGIIAHNKKHDGKDGYFIYVWMMKFAPIIQQFIEKTTNTNILNEINNIK